MEKYPIPKQKSNYNLSSQIEGSNCEVTSGDDNEVCKDSEKYDAKYICPITKQLMNEPVIAYDGCVYEKAAIVKYIKQHKSTPMQINKKRLSQDDVEQMIANLYLHYQYKMQIDRLKGYR